MIDLNELRLCKRRVDQFRSIHAHRFPTPNTLQSLFFALTELAEALDAYMRQSHPEFQRNHHRNVDVLDELADCAFMLLTALPDIDGIERTIVADRYWGRMFDDLGEAALFCQVGRETLVWQPKAKRVLWCIATYPGMNLGKRLESRLKQIEAKIMEKQDAE